MRPTLQAQDARALIRDYVEVFGSLATAMYGERDRVDHAQLDTARRGGCSMLGSHKPYAEWPIEPGRRGGRRGQRPHEEVWQAGAGRPAAAVTRPLTAPDYGGQEFRATAGGQARSFGIYRGEPAAEGSSCTSLQP